MSCLLSYSMYSRKRPEQAPSNASSKVLVSSSVQPRDFLILKHSSNFPCDKSWQTFLSLTSYCLNKYLNRCCVQNLILLLALNMPPETSIQCHQFTTKKKKNKPLITSLSVAFIMKVTEVVTTSSAAFSKAEVSQVIQSFLVGKKDNLSYPA